MAAYTPTNYVNGQAPAINATDLNHLTAELVLQAADPAINTSTFLTPTYWVNGSTHAVSDPTGLNEMERIISLGAAHFSLQYTPTTWQSGWVPARNATRLNNMELAAQTIRAQLDFAPPPGLPTAPTGLVVTPGNNQLTLTWDANPAGENVDVYQVYEGSPGNEGYFNSTWLNRPTSPRSYTMTTDHTGVALAAGNTYYVRVGAHNSTGYGPWCNAVTGVPTGAPPPNNRYTNITFSDSLYGPIGDGVATQTSDSGSVFEATTVDARLSDWGGLPPPYYDNPGAFGYSPGTSMTTDPNQRVYLFDPLSRGLPRDPYNNSPLASWQELRTTDGPWNPVNVELAKSSLKFSVAKTWGPGGWPGFNDSSIRWFAVDFLLPLNIVAGGVPTSYEFIQSAGGWSGSLLIDMHDSGGTGGSPLNIEIEPEGNSHPKYLSFRFTPNQNSGGVPYTEQNLAQLTNANGTRITSVFNTWHEIVVGHRSGYDATGWQEAWFNGVQVMPRIFKANLAVNEGGPYWALQNYTSHQNPVYFGGATRSAVVYGGFRAGHVRSDVQMHA